MGALRVCEGGPVPFVAVARYIQLTSLVPQDYDHLLAVDNQNLSLLISEHDYISADIQQECCVHGIRVV